MLEGRQLYTILVKERAECHCWRDTLPVPDILVPQLDYGINSYLKFIDQDIFGGKVGVEQ